MYWICLSKEQISSLLKLLAEEIEGYYRLGKEFEAYRKKLQAIYDQLLLILEKDK